jgi:hypothetical protein
VGAIMVGQGKDWNRTRDNSKDRDKDRGEGIVFPSIYSSDMNK